METRLAPGFLIAMPQLDDPNFERSVVLLLHHDDEGAMGVVINRRTEVGLDAFCRKHELTYGGAEDRCVHLGGPCEQQRGFLLHQEPALTAQHAGASDGIRFKMKRDPRVTRVGAFLRRFSLDEVPQLWNVFCGDMTLVGPRPAVRREVVLYSPTDARRLEVTPGLTCLWQVGGRSELSFQQQVSLDLQFIDTVGPLGEIAIVLRTVPAVLSGRGAY